MGESEGTVSPGRRWGRAGIQSPGVWRGGHLPHHHGRRGSGKACGHAGPAEMWRSVPASQDTGEGEPRVEWALILPLPAQESGHCLSPTHSRSHGRGGQRVTAGEVDTPPAGPGA